MHHRPARPPLPARVAGALARSGLLLSGFLRVRAGRVLLGGAATAVVTGLVVAMPVLAGSGAESSSVFTDSSSGVPSSPAEDPVFAAPEGGWPAETPDATGAVPDAAATSPSTATTTDAPTSSSAAPGSSAATTSSSAADAPTPSGAAPSSGGAPSASPASETPSGDEVPPSAAAVEVAPGGDLLAVLDRTRAAAGCAPLTVDDDLSAAAREHSQDMQDDDFLGLVDDDGDSVLDEADAAAGWVAHGTQSPVDVVSGWLAQGDAAALEDCSLTAVGIGRSGGEDGPWWTVLLA